MTRSRGFIVSSGGPAGMITAYIDGGARGNPGPAGYGVHIEDGNGALVEELHGALGVATNNVAEYNGLLAALRWAADRGERHLRIRSDSELLVKQIRRDYKVKSPDLKELYDRATILIRKLTSFSIQHVLREKNRDADRLANWAMDNPALCGSSYIHGRRQGAASSLTKKS